MDSGNSGSFQSSSGEEEFDSQADGISALMNNPPPPHQPPPSRPPPSTAISSIYDKLLSNYFDPMSRPPPPPPSQPLQNPNVYLNSDINWATKTLRSESNPMDINPILGSSSSSLQSLLVSQNQTQLLELHNQGSSVAPTQENSPPEPTNLVTRNPRKRSRASRRAPTTVLTTDTANFRAMVQEFTGIPAPPFAASSPYQRSRLDLFSSMATSQPPPPSYLRRPFPQKVQLPPPPFSLGTSSPINNALNSANSSINYHFSPQNSSIYNLSNPFGASFMNNSPLLSTKPHQESSEFALNGSNMKVVGGLDEFNNGNQVDTMTTLSGLPGLISSDQTTSRSNNDQAAVGWGNGVGSSQDDDQSHVTMPSANGNFSFSS